ncbi:MAG: alpha/beta hydrolase-fold protein [Planctomycetota bacterium]
MRHRWLLCLFAFLVATTAPAGTVRFDVVDRSGMFEADRPTLFIASSANGWNSSGTPSSGATETGWWFELPEREAFAPGFEFKFTRGRWQTVEVGSGGLDIANRSITRADARATGGGVPVVSLELAGFADQRGSRWNMQDQNDSSVVGRLDIVSIASEVFDRERTVRVWLPPGYDQNPDARYPVFYMHDGQNCFDRSTSFIGVEWQVDEAATALINDGAIEPIIIVGIDNSGVDRSLDYLPMAPGVRAPTMRGGGADDYLNFLQNELMPHIAEHYRVDPDPAHTGIGGSSFGGVITSYAVTSRPELFGRALIESPSLWVGDGRLMDMLGQADAWPERVFLAMGTKEYGEPGNDARLVSLTNTLADAIRSAQGSEDGLMLEVQDGAVHNEGAWAGRFPRALEFLYSPSR